MDLSLPLSNSTVNQILTALLLEPSEERIRAKLRADQEHRAREVLARRLAPSLNRRSFNHLSHHRVTVV
jgi:hypothetical protein